MSFLSIFNSIIKTASKYEPIAAKYVPMVVPQSASIFTLIDPLFHGPLNTIVANELSNPGAGNGAFKLDSAIQSFVNQDDIARMQAIAANSGMKLVWDDASLKAGLSAQADVYNYFAKVKASMKLVPLAPAPPTS